MKNVAALILLLAVCWLAYLPGTSGGLHFDDNANLGALATADSPLLLLDFILSGQAGPTGRPLSLASFAIQRDLWPKHVDALIHTNVILHLLAAVFVYLTARGMSQAIFNNPKRSDCASLLATALWVFSPLLASAPLMLVQRMTVLSGLFVFMGLAFYTWSRLWEMSNPSLSKSLMYVGVPLAFVLAVLSKENGILIAPLILVTEYLVLRRVTCLVPVERKVEYALLAVSGFIAVYLAAELPNLMRGGWRDFSPLERLLAQPSVMGDYIQGLLIPQVSNISPFSEWENIRVDDNFPSKYTGIVVVGLLITCCVLLRKRYPLLVFCIASFLIGHSIESSVVYLELYFSHRNYIPAFFVYLMLGVGAASVNKNYRVLVCVGAVLYAASTLIVLYSGSTLWGDRMIAAEMWHKYFPQSERAAHALANRYVEVKDYQTALIILDDLEERSGKPGMYKAQTLLLCQTTKEDVAVRIDDVIRGFSEGPRIRGVGETIELLTLHAIKGKCETLTLQDVRRIAVAAISGRTYRHDANVRAKALVSIALVSAEEGNYNDAYKLINFAFDEKNILDIGLLRLNMHLLRHDFKGARVYLDYLKEKAPPGVLKNAIWMSRVSEWRAIIDNAETSSLENDGESS